MMTKVLHRQIADAARRYAQAGRADTGLLSLEKEWLALGEANHTNSEAEYDANFARQGVIVEKILNTSARTTAGAAVKLRFFALLTDVCFDLREKQASDLQLGEKMALSTLADLEKMGPPVGRDSAAEQL